MNSHTEISHFLLENNISIVCIQESKLTNTSTLKPFPGYTVVRKDRGTGRGGGLLTLVEESTTYTPWDTSHLFPGDNTAETLGIEAVFGGLPLKIVNVYILPCSSCPPDYQTEFSHITTPQDNTLLLGDFNAHHPSWYSATNDDRAEARGTALGAELADSDFGVLNEDTPTRAPKNGPTSSPDISIVSGHLLLDLSWETRTQLNSDHLPIVIEIATNQYSPPVRKRRTYTNFSKADWEGYRLETERLFRGATEPSLCSSGERIFRSILATASKHHIPAGFQRDPISQMPQDARPLIADRDARRSADPQDGQLPALEAQISQSIKTHNLNKWKELLQNSSRSANPARYWYLLRKMSGKKEKLPPNQPISFGGSTLTNPKDIAQAFTRQFTSVVAKTSDRNTRKVIRRIKKNYKKAPPPSFTTEEVKRAIKNTGNSTAIGPDGLTALHIKNLGELGVGFLVKIFNLSIGRADIPAIWKNSIILPIPKPGKPKDLGSSYRPISLLCPAVKVLERLLLPFLVDDLHTAKSQHGFKPHHSTVTALLPLTTAITQGFNQKRPPSRTIAVAIDISKAFDSVDHCLLLDMISGTDLSPTIIRWLAAYIRGRKATCTYREQTADFMGVPAGVPQGSVISPALFNFFISDCPVPAEEMTSYADDITIWTTSPILAEAEQHLNSHLSRLHTWTNQKRLSIAPHKSSVTLFTPDTHQSTYHPKIFINNSQIPLDRSPKILGVTLDTHFTFAAHSKTVHSRSTASLNILKALTTSSWGFSKENILSTYKALTRPIINYGAPIWHPNLARSRLQKLETVQNSALRIATGCHKMAAIDHLHTETNILPLHTHLDLSCMQFLATALDPGHPSWLSISPRTHRPRPMKHLLQSRYFNTLQNDINSPNQIMFLDALTHDNYKVARRRLRACAVSRTIEASAPNRILMAPPPEIDPSEELLPRVHRTTLSQLRSGFCKNLNAYKFRIGLTNSNLCPDCGAAEHSTPHLFSCPAQPTDLSPADLCLAPLEAAAFLASTPSFQDLPPLPFLGQPDQPPF